MPPRERAFHKNWWGACATIPNSPASTTAKRPPGERDREFLFQHRYLLSEAVNAQRFTAAGLSAAIRETIDNLASPAGLLFKSLLPRDPTGELLTIIDQLASSPQPESRDGVWVGSGGTRALAVAQTQASGSDSDAQSRAIDAIRAAFTAAAAESPQSGGKSVQLRLSGPGVFAVAARAKIERAAVRLSIASGILVVTLLLLVYRSLPALGLGLLPVATGALVGVGAVALGFGAVHGITLGFGITLIGESVDYSIYFFVQSRQSQSAPGSWQQLWWPTIRLGMLTSVCGFASLLPSGFPGLKQLGLYSISGLIAAALVTRYVLPALLPAGFAIRDVKPVGLRVGGLLRGVQNLSGRALLLSGAAFAALAVAVLYHDRGSLWNRELSALSPISTEEQNYDAKLRADLGAADVRDLVIVSGPDVESILRGAEHAAGVLQSMVNDKVIGGFENPAAYLPSMATQESRRSSLPGAAELRANLGKALEGLPLRAASLQPFLEDVEATRHAALVTPRDLAGTSLAAGFDALVLHQKDQWHALAPAAQRHSRRNNRHEPGRGGAATQPRRRGARARSEAGIGCAIRQLSGGSHSLFIGRLSGIDGAAADRAAFAGARGSRAGAAGSGRSHGCRGAGHRRRAIDHSAPGRNAADRGRGFELRAVLRSSSEL